MSSASCCFQAAVNAAISRVPSQRLNSTASGAGARSAPGMRPSLSWMTKDSFPSIVVQRVSSARTLGRAGGSIKFGPTLFTERLQAFPSILAVQHETLAGHLAVQHSLEIEPQAPFERAL